jgi:uncharacterized repeat protein (TIGR03803 family)
MLSFHRALIFTTTVLAFASAALALAQGNEKVIHTFQRNGKGGIGPTAAPIRDAAGNLYGTAYTGGSHECEGQGCGIVYELSPKAGGGWAEKVLHVFRFNGKDGVFPSARLTMDEAGNLFGTTADGGDGCGGYGCGTVFELSPTGDGTWKATTLHSFNGADGQVIFAGIVLGSDGYVYGTAYTGGARNAGVAFQLSPGKNGNWKETVLHEFTGDRDGGGPGQLISDHAGSLYGTTAYGGAHLYGTVFELSQSGGKWKETVLYNFKPNKSDLFVSSVILDNSGGFYGTLVSQQTDGAIFQLKQVNGQWKKTIIFRFDFDNGDLPMSNLTLDAAGNIFGTTEFGGSHDFGVVYELSPTKSGWKQRVLHEFAGQKDGANPFDGVVLDQSGHLCGTTSFGGTPDFGIVFQVTP